MEGDKVEVAMHEVETGGLEFFHGHGPLSTVLEDDAPRDDIEVRQDAIEERYVEPEPFGAQNDGERLRVLIFPLRIHGGEPVEAIFSRQDLMRVVFQFAPVRTGRIPQHQERTAEIAGALCRKFLRHKIEQIVHGTVSFSPIIQMQQISEVVDFHLVRRVVGMDREGVGFFRKKDRHNTNPLIKSWILF